MNSFRQLALIPQRKSGPISTPCVCGGQLVAEANTPEAIQAAVAVHNQSLLHLDWRGQSDFDWIRFGPIKWPEFLHGDVA